MNILKVLKVLKGSAMMQDTPTLEDFPVWSEEYAATMAQVSY